MFPSERDSPRIPMVHDYLNISMAHTLYFHVVYTRRNVKENSPIIRFMYIIDNYEYNLNLIFNSDVESKSVKSTALAFICFKGYLQELTLHLRLNFPGCLISNKISGHIIQKTWNQHFQGSKQFRLAG